MIGEMETPGARASAAGADSKAFGYGQHNSLPGADCASPFSDVDAFMDNVARTVAAHAAIDAVFACDPDDRRWLIEMILNHMPPHDPDLAPDHLALTWARGWAETATRRERKAWVLACYEAMTPADQAAFLDYLRGRPAA